MAAAKDVTDETFKVPSMSPTSFLWVWGERKKKKDNSNKDRDHFLCDVSFAGEVISCQQVAFRELSAEVVHGLLTCAFVLMEETQLLSATGEPLQKLFTACFPLPRFFFPSTANSFSRYPLCLAVA